MGSNFLSLTLLCFVACMKNLTTAEVLSKGSDLAEKYSYEVIPQPPTTPPNMRNTRSTVQRYRLAEFDLAHVYLPLMATLALLSSNVIKILYQLTPKVPQFLPESCMLILVGLMIGALVRFGFHIPTSPFTADLFFLFILPPIIFDAGYFMPERMFFNNLGTILLMAFVGTIFNIFAIGFSLWGCGLTGIYGGPAETPNTVVAATDPVAVLAVFEEMHVNELLYIIVFGEALLNDAVTVVIYHVMEVYSKIGFDNVIPQDIVSGFISFFIVSLGGVLIGIIWALLTGYVTRFTNRVLVVETSFIFLMSYIAYLNAEMLHMSGILAATFCGITMKGYVEANISKSSKLTIRNGLKMVSNSAETLVFILLGVATVQSYHVWNTSFVLLAVLFCSIFRIISVTALTFISNRYRLNKLTVNDQIIMSLGGLRGAVAFALVLLMDRRLVPQQPMFLTTTLVIIFFTVFIQGILTKPVLKWLNIKLQAQNKLSMSETISERFTDHVMTGIEDVVGVNGNYNTREKFKRFSKRFIEPWVLSDVNQPDSFTHILKNIELEEVQTAGRNICYENTLTQFEALTTNNEKNMQLDTSNGKAATPVSVVKSSIKKETQKRSQNLLNCKRPKSI